MNAKIVGKHININQELVFKKKKPFICEKHTSQPIDYDLHRRHRNGLIKRKIFERRSGFTIFTIPQCCLMKKDFSALKGSCFFNENLADLWDINMSLYNRDNYTRMSFDKGRVQKKFMENSVIGGGGVSKGHIQFFGTKWSKNHF